MRPAQFFIYVPAVVMLCGNVAAATYLLFFFFWIVVVGIVYVGIVVVVIQSVSSCTRPNNNRIRFGLGTCVFYALALTLYVLCKYSSSKQIIQYTMKQKALCVYLCICECMFMSMAMEH